MNELAYYLIQTPDELKKELYFQLQSKGYNTLFEDGYLYAKGEIPVLLVAHMDTVATHPPKKIMYIDKKDKIYNPDGILGGDDRCGVYAIIQLLDKFKPHVLFTEDEEIGCVGAKKAVDTLEAPDVKYIIEIDRRGKDDCVFYDCGNKEFMKYVEKFGFVKNYGSCSDISVLSRAWNIASVNLSSGYYNEHTEKEHIIFHELTNTIKRIENMLNVLDKAPHFDYQEIKHYQPVSTFFRGYVRTYFPTLFYAKELMGEDGFFDEKKYADFMLYHGFNTADEANRYIKIINNIDNGHRSKGDK